MDNAGTFAWQMEAWVLIGRDLCGLVDQLHTVGYRHTLEVDLRLMKIGSEPGEYGFARF